VKKELGMRTTISRAASAAGFLTILFASQFAATEAFAGAAPLTRLERERLAEEQRLREEALLAAQQQAQNELAEARISGTPVRPVFELGLHPEVEKAVIAAREAEARARSRAAEARDAQARARSAAEAARQAAASRAGAQNFPGSGAYEGQLTDGVRQGHGVFVGVDGERYEGEWRANLRNGHGITNPRSGIRFEGTWRNGNPCGIGVVTWPNGDRFEGDYCQGDYTGVGVFYSGVMSSPARESAGHWIGGKQTGLSVRVWKDNTRTEGVWRDGKLNGYAAEFSLTGRVQTQAGWPRQGIYTDDKLTMQLVPADFVLVTSDPVEPVDPNAPPPPPPPVPPPFVAPVEPAPPLAAGTENAVPLWERELSQLILNPQVATSVRAARDAETQARAKAQAAREAQMRARAAAERARTFALQARENAARTRGRVESLAVQSFASIGTYEGQVAPLPRQGNARFAPAGFMRQGAGVFVGADGERFEGEWAADQRNGVGITTPTSGIRFEGTWREGAPCGLGVVTWPDGSRYEGDYCRGHYTGYGVFTTLPTSVDRENAGQWAESKQTGPGVRIWKDNTRWEGMWENGKLKGPGAKLLVEGLQQGMFENDELRTPLTP
jgi:hypothetical protein